MQHITRITLILITLAASSLPAHQETQMTFQCAPEQECSKRVACLEIDETIIDPTPYTATFHAIKQQAHALLLVINSGGGAAGASEAIAREVTYLTRSIPVVTYIKNICASGAYLIACKSNCIIAPRMSDVGSIGAFTTVVKQDIHDFEQTSGDNNGNKESVSGTISFDVISASKKKVSHHPLTDELTEEEREERVEDTRVCGEQFAQQVIEARNQLKDNQDMWATGELFNGERAYELGLIDQNGSYSDALDAMYHLLQNNEPEKRITNLKLEAWHIDD